MDINNAKPFLRAKPFFDILSYHDYISPGLAHHLLESGSAVAGIDGLVEVGRRGGLETEEALRFLVELYDSVKDQLRAVLLQRSKDRKFIDERVHASSALNPSAILGLQDGNGRIVIGPKNAGYARSGGKPIAPLPEFLKGPHVTLFGPPDSAKLAINAMNAFHRKIAGEPAIVEKLLGNVNPMWGADDEDSKTPLRQDLVEAAVNLTACFDGSLSLEEGGKSYSLAKDHLALPIKRFPGLALPSTFLFYRKNPIPLHLYDFALHLFRNYDNPRALTFYVPKLENEEEASYVHSFVQNAESMVRKIHPSYTLGTVRLMIVLENPRAILRTHEIMDALHPYFAGASLGWHDYLASTARIFKEDSGYRIPVKADPEIVIKYIKASHHLLADTVGSRGGIRVGGMYGILPIAGDSVSLQVTLKGFIKDVVTQMKRGLNGFWVAHPDFVRLGLALVEAWRRRQNGDPEHLKSLVAALLDNKHRDETLRFIDAPDIEGLNIDDPNYVSSLLVADIKESDFIANNHPDEIRYNVFQSLQYLADWLAGNGCVALPTHVEGIGVRVMDDLATAERSRWEVWHEIRHGRFALDDFLRIAQEEMNFIRRDLSNQEKIVQVKWNDRTSKWYPIAMKIMVKLMTDPHPPEFTTELLMPLTVESIRHAADPLGALGAIDPEKYRLPKYIEDFNHYFEICGSQRFAHSMALNLFEDVALAKKVVLGFSLAGIQEAASFHGNIGDSRKVLDSRAADEQSLVLNEDQSVKNELAQLGADYLKKFGVKFLISAQGKSATEIRGEIKRRISLSPAEELQNARQELWEITRKRMESSRVQGVASLEALRSKHGITSASITISRSVGTQNIALGAATPDQQFEIASLSKTVAAAFAVEYFAKRNIPLSTSVNSLFEETSSPFRIPGEFGKEVSLLNLLNHTALNMHYVQGFPAGGELPKMLELLQGGHGYDRIQVAAQPGVEFHYSGGGFLVLEHLLESREGRSIKDLLRPFLDSLGLQDLTFDRSATTCQRELDFPALAAGGFSTSESMSKFLQHLANAFQSLEGSSVISHDTAVLMLHGADKGAHEFMGCDIGLGVFIAEAGENRFMVHQGANEGFRALYVKCFAGPNFGDGITILSQGDNAAVPFIAEVAQEIFTRLEMKGVDFTRLAKNFETGRLKQEEIVNVGYKTLLFDAFLPDLPEEIVTKGPLDPLAEFNLAAQSQIRKVTNQKFARAENLISRHLPVFDPELFGRQGKIMDSWESARHNPVDHDSLTLELRRPSKIKFVSISTKFHDGNHAEFVRLLGLNPQNQWVELVPKMPFQGHALLQLKVSSGAADVPYSQVRLEMYPDGGISRLGLFNELPEATAKNFLENAKCVRFSDAIPKTSKPLTLPFENGTTRGEETNAAREREAAINWASAAHGAKLLSATNEHYGPAVQVISPYPPIHMFDGLESARSRMNDHFEEVVIALGKPIRIGTLELDFRFFVNNNPLFVSIHGYDGKKWEEVVSKTSVKAFAGNQKRFRITNEKVFAQIMLRTYPDGGVHRIKVFERVSPDATTH